jgi:hypothetical protein
VSTSSVKLGASLTNRVSIIIRNYIDRMKFAAYMAFSLIAFFSYFLVPFFTMVYMVVCFVCFCLILQVIYSF